MLGSNILVVGGISSYKSVSIESCELSNGQFSCTAFDWTFESCVLPLLHVVDETYENC